MQKDIRLKKILVAATNVFAEKGFHQAKMDDIARLAQVAKGTLYYNYASKSKLFAATVIDGMDEIMAGIEREMESDLPFIDHFRLLVTCTIRLYLHHSEVTRIYTNELTSSIDQETLEEVRKVRHRFIDFIAGIVRKGQEKGYLRLLNPRISALALVGMFDSLCNDQLSDVPTSSTDEIIDSVFCILSEGLLSPDRKK
jgi:TetR/AcrR family transcriptional regulator